MRLQVRFFERRKHFQDESAEPQIPRLRSELVTFYLACSLWLESYEQHLLISTAGVLRLRAIGRPLCESSARRFTQDDGFAGRLENIR
jgi:hypothetical protein